MLRSGPLLEIVVEPILDLQEAWRQDGRVIPSVPVTALLDTGASHTVIQSNVFDRLGLESVGSVFFSTPSTTEPIVRLQYLVRLILANGIAFEVEVAEAPLGGQEVQCLIGRDLLDYTVLTYNGPKNHYTLNFPEVPEDV